jgi:hypothetical protein
VSYGFNEWFVKAGWVAASPLRRVEEGREDRVAYVQMKIPTATPNKNAKQTAIQNWVLLV